jgi:hypothetical protein
MAVGKYNLLQEYADDPNSKDLASSPHWVLAVVRLAKPLSYSRQKKKSDTLDVSEGAVAHGKTLIITSDCITLHVHGSKDNHVKSLSATLIQTDTNYLVEILPGDWLFAWIVHGKDKASSLVERIRKGEACNKFEDGLKFVGRVESIRKKMSRNESGIKTSRYQLQGYGFRELDTMIFYDHHLRSNESQDLGTWLHSIGLDIRELFSIEANGQKDNVHLLIPAYLEVLVGKGVSKKFNTTDDSSLRQATGGGITEGPDGKTKEAPFAYLVPKEVGDLLGKKSRSPSKASGILAYADILELVFGVQKYENTNSNAGYKVFIPTIAVNDPLTTTQHRYTGIPMMGAFLPLPPNFDNRPLWSVLQQYLNPVINEMYTCLRVNENGDVVPTMVLRQIPFTTDILADKLESMSGNTLANESGPLAPGSVRVTVTRFSELPRWVLPGVMVYDIDIGRSDASRCNFVHVYGQNADVSSNIEITEQIVNNPPIRDDFDIQRSGLHTFMATVACREINQVGTTPSVWMEIIADHRIGSQYTLNGSIRCIGIEAPICEGDNLEFDGVVYHIESVSHSCSISSDGIGSWTTSLTLTNGMRAFGDKEIPPTDTNESNPIYPGFRKGDNTRYDGFPSTDDDAEKLDNKTRYEPKQAGPNPDPNSNTRLA